jgi:hypothetical protein
MILGSAKCTMTRCAEGRKRLDNCAHDVTRSLRRPPPRRPRRPTRPRPHPRSLRLSPARPSPSLRPVSSFLRLSPPLHTLISTAHEKRVVCVDGPDWKGFVCLRSRCDRRGASVSVSLSLILTSTVADRGVPAEARGWPAKDASRAWVGWSREIGRWESIQTWIGRELSNKESLLCRSRRAARMETLYQ